MDRYFEGSWLYNILIKLLVNLHEFPRILIKV